MPTAATTLHAPLPWLGPALAICLALAGIAVLRRVRGTTLTAPTLWWMAAALALAVVEAAIASGRLAPATLAGSLWRYTAAVGTFCPLVAVLGAKRPQDRGWQWVLAALWLVLLVPVAQAIVAPGGTRLELFAAWQWLLWGFIAMGLLNYLPTRFAISALLAAAGQYRLFDGAAGQLAEPAASRATLWGLGLLVAAWIAGEVAAATSRPSPTLLPQSRRWLAFRDAWGAFWAIRVLQRVNESAELGGWPIRLQWSGVATASDAAIVDELPPDLEAALDQSLDNLLRRFERADR
jgi:hypothetical protein